MYLCTDNRTQQMGKWTILRQRIHEYWLYYYGYRLMLGRQRRFIKELQQRDVIKVVFVVLNVSMWKYQGIYDLLAADSRFQVFVVLSPGITYKPEQRLRDLQQMRDYFGSRKMAYVDWDLEHDAPAFDIRRELNPDIIFYMQPYHGSYHDRHCFLHFTDRLIVYSPYSYLQVHVPYNYDNVLQNVAWRNYYVSRYHLTEAQVLARNRGVNAVAVGYTSADVYQQNQYREVWRDADHTRRRLIWAPHCTLANDGTAFSRSNFLVMADFMVQLAERYQDQLQIAFKPHPGLLTELYMHPEWGKEKADAYYDRWRNMPNTQLADGEFVNLFQGSDAMVHDSGSFVVDYLYFQKPVMYVSQDIQRAKSYANIPGQQAYDAHYIGRTCDDVAHFVEHVVLSGQDTMQARRQTFYQEFLAQPGGQSTAQNIYQDIIHQLCKQSS